LSFSSVLDPGCGKAVGRNCENAKARESAK
jgi:hypothetical protein